MAETQEQTADKQSENEQQQKDDDSKKEYRLASDLNATKPSLSIWKESENIIRMTSEPSKRVSVIERLKGFQKQIEAANSLEPTRAKVKNREQARWGK